MTGQELRQKVGSLFNENPFDVDSKVLHISMEIDVDYDPDGLYNDLPEYFQDQYILVKDSNQIKDIFLTYISDEMTYCDRFAGEYLNSVTRFVMDINNRATGFRQSSRGDYYIIKLIDPKEVFIPFNKFMEVRKNVD